MDIQNKLKLIVFLLSAAIISVGCGGTLLEENPQVRESSKATIRDGDYSELSNQQVEYDESGNIVSVRGLEVTESFTALKRDSSEFQEEHSDEYFEKLAEYRNSEEKVFNFQAPESQRAEFSPPVMVTSANLTLTSNNNNHAKNCTLLNYSSIEPSIKDLFKTAATDNKCGKVVYEFCIRKSFTNDFNINKHFSYLKSPPIAFYMPCLDDIFKQIDFKINRGEDSTDSTEVLINYSPNSLINRLYLTNDQNCKDNGTWYSIDSDQHTQNWKLSGTGQQKVYATFKNVFGGTSTCFQDTILVTEKVSNESTSSEPLLGNQSPTMTDINDATIQVDQIYSSTFNIEDLDSAIDCTSEFLSINSDSLSLVKNDSVTFSVSGSSCMITITPESSQSGSAEITVTLKDNDTDLKQVSQKFKLYVSLPLQVQPRYAVAAQWNHYYLTSDTSQSCDLAETIYSNCGHGGEEKRVNTGLTSCSGLSMEDQLGVFNWICVVEPGPVAVFYSDGFKTKKGLKNLINSASWKANSVTLNASVQSPSSQWWSNSVGPLPDSSASVVTLSTSEKVYTLSVNSITKGYHIDADKISIVTLPNIVLTWDGSATTNVQQNTGTPGTNDFITLLMAGSNHYLWIEGNFSGDGSGGLGTDAQGILVTSTSHYLRIHNSSFSNVSSRAIRQRYSDCWKVTNTIADLVPEFYWSDRGTGKLFKDINVTNNSGPAIYGRYTQNYVLENIKVQGVDGIRFDYSSGVKANSLKIHCSTGSGFGWYTWLGGGHRFNMTKIANCGQGIRDYGNSGPSYYVDTLISGGTNGLVIRNHPSVAVATTLINLSGKAIEFEDNGTIVNSAIANVDTGIYIQSTTNNGTVSQVSILNTTNYAIDNQTDSGSGHKFTNYLRFGNNGLTCRSANINTGITDSSCIANSASDHTIRSGLNAASTFVGYITDDVSNTSDNSGIATFASADVFSFENHYRVFNKYATSFPVISGQGAWTSGNGSIFDASLRVGDTIFKNTTGDGNSQNNPFIGGEICPSEIHGNEITTALSGQTFLSNAYEIMFDGNGDDDGLCETGEKCVYMPNFGAYQGHGSYQSNICNFVDGTVAGVTMHAYTENGR